MVKQQNPAEAEGAQSQSKGKVSLLERVLSLVGALLVGSIIVYLLVQAVSGDHTPPNIRIEQQALSEVEGGYLLQIKIINTGGSAAANLQIEGELLQGEEAAETSTATIDYVAGDSHHGIGLFFTNDPRQYTLELRAVSYQEP